ncbi:MAG: DNA repair protein RecN [Gemmatimonadaceae bacterium]|nr:DNA repair protein RecN [Gemmatimonadaceae bacterium]
MLTELRIRNVAIIESVTLPLAPGFNVLTGETGAGKSIIVEALGLLFGERASADVVRSGSDRATVEGVFDLGANASVAALLDERGIDVEDGIVVFKREVAATGRSRAWINGTVVTSGLLAEVGARLVNIHGQHESRGLLDPEAQREVLDAYAGASEAAAGVALAWDALGSVRTEVAALVARRDSAAKRADYLRHAVQELRDAKLAPGEDQRLEEEHRRLANVGELRLHVEQLRQAIEDEQEGALRALAAARRALGAAARVDASLERLRDLLEAGTVQLEELAREASHYEDSLDADPERLIEVERRRDLLYRLSRKHGGSVASAIEACAEAQRELDLLDTASLDLGQLAQREVELEAALTEAARTLSMARRKAARRLEKAVDAVLPDLGMADGRLTVQLSARDVVGRSGAEEVEFLVTLNVGHHARPLARVASGGELARVMLALKTILARIDHVPTLVFDEVDAGIGGAVGLHVGDTMRRVAEHHQVFAITHLAQIASRAHRHVVVSKGARSGVTTADIAVAEGDARVREIARMLGGDARSALGQQHAKELLVLAKTSAVR